MGEHFYVIMDGLCGVYITKFKDDDFSNLFCCKTLGIGKSFGGIFMILDFRIGSHSPSRTNSKIHHPLLQQAHCQHEEPKY